MTSKSQNCTGCFLVASPYLTDGHFFRSVVFVVRHTEEGAFGVIVNRGTSKRFSEVVEMSSPSWQSSPAKPLGENTEDPLPQSNSQTTPPRDLIYLGGPVEGPLLALHDVAGIGEPCGNVSVDEVDASTAQNPAGVKMTIHDHPADAFGSISIQWSSVPAWMTADEDHLRILARRSDARLKFIVGYSGWGAGQLEQELDAGGWLVTPAESDSIFTSSEEVWDKLVHRCGHAILKDLRPDLTLPDEDVGFDPGVN